MDPASVGGDGGGFGGGAAHDWDEGGQGGEKGSRGFEDGVVGDHGGFALDEAEDHGSGLMSGGYCIAAPTDHRNFHHVHHVARAGAESADVRAEDVGVGLLEAQLHRLNSGDANAAAEIADEIEEAGGVAHGFFGDAGHGDRGERDEDEAERKAHFKLWPEEIPVACTAIEMGEFEKSERTDEEAEAEKFARIEFGDDEADDGHGDEGTESARSHGDAGAQGGIAQKRLQDERDENGGAVEADAEHGH